MFNTCFSFLQTSTGVGGCDERCQVIYLTVKSVCNNVDEVFFWGNTGLCINISALFVSSGQIVTSSKVPFVKFNFWNKTNLNCWRSFSVFPKLSILELYLFREYKCRHQGHSPLKLQTDCNYDWNSCPLTNSKHLYCSYKMWKQPKQYFNTQISHWSVVV